MTTILGIGIGVAVVVFVYHAVVLVYASRTRWFEKRLRQYVR